MDSKHIAVLQVVGFEKPLFIPFTNLPDLAEQLEIVARELRNETGSKEEAVTPTIEPDKIGDYLRKLSNEALQD